MTIQDYRDFMAEVLIEPDRLQKRVQELGAEISRDYQGHDLLLICILRGGVMFLTDLMRAITIPHAVDFMAVASYGAGARDSQGQGRITLDLTASIEGRRGAPGGGGAGRRGGGGGIHYRGFTIPDKFVFGYGLDLDEYYRNLPFIGVVQPDKVLPTTQAALPLPPESLIPQA